MKYKVKLELSKNEIRKDYRRTIISFFKNAISRYMGGEFYDSLYNDGARKKSMVWSIRFSNPKFEGNIIKLEDREVEITLKFADAETALVYYSSLLEEKGNKFPVGGDNYIVLKSIRMVRDPEIASDLAVFKIMSPLCLKMHIGDNGKDWFYSYGDSDFALELQKKLEEDLPYMKDEVAKVRYNFDGLRKAVIEEYGIKIPCTIGTFIMQGHPKVLNHVLKNGIGSKRNSGFGLVEQVLQGSR